MKGLLELATAAMLVAPAVAGPLLEARKTGNNKDRCNHDNPFKGLTQYVNKGYAKKVDETVKSFKKKGDKQGVAGAKALQKIPTFIWLSFIEDVSFSDIFDNIVVVTLTDSSIRNTDQGLGEASQGCSQAAKQDRREGHRSFGHLQLARA